MSQSVSVDRGASCERWQPDRDRAWASTALVDGAPRRAASASSARPCATARSSTTSSSRRPTCPIGWTDEQDGGHATGSSAATTRRASATPSGRTRGSSFLFPPRVRLWRARRRRRRRSTIEEEPLDATPLAFIGVRSCELHAIAIQDRVFLGGTLRRPRLRRAPRGRVHRRRQLLRAGRHLLLRLDGHRARRPSAGYDLALTEILDGEHRFLVEVGSERGAEVLAELPRAAGAAGRPRRRRRAPSSGAAARMGRTLDTTDLRDLLARNLEHPRWDEVADALPDLRQLHARLPDLLLHDASRTTPT